MVKVDISKLDPAAQEYRTKKKKVLICVKACWACPVIFMVIAMALPLASMAGLYLAVDGNVAEIMVWDTSYDQLSVDGHSSTVDDEIGDLIKLTFYDVVEYDPEVELSEGPTELTALNFDGDASTFSLDKTERFETLTHAAREYSLGSLNVVYQSANPLDLNVLSDEFIEAAHEIETAILYHENLRPYCLESAIGVCQNALSPMNYFYPSEDNAGDITFDGKGEDRVSTDVAIYQIELSGAEDFFDSSYNDTYALYFWATYYWGGPLEGYTSVYDDGAAQTAKVTGYINGMDVNFLEDLSNDRVQIIYMGEDIVGNQLLRALASDFNLAGIGFTLVFLFGWALTGSFFLILFGLFHVFMSFPPAMYLFRRKFGGTTSILNGISIWIILGIGCDDIFVSVDMWKQAPYGLTAMEKIDYGFRHTGAAIFATSFTTAAAFFGNAISDIGPIKQFGYFMGCLVTFNYYMVMTFFPCCIVIYSRCCRCDRRKKAEKARRRFIANIIDRDVDTTGFGGAKKNVVDAGFDLDEEEEFEEFEEESEHERPVLNVLRSTKTLANLAAIGTGFTNLVSNLDNSDAKSGCMRKFARGVVRFRWFTLTFSFVATFYLAYQVQFLTTSDNVFLLMREDSNFELAREFTKNIDFDCSAGACDTSSEASFTVADSSVSSSYTNAYPFFEWLPSGTVQSLQYAGAATSVAVTTVDHYSIQVTWGAPASDGGSDVDGYEITYNTDGEAFTGWIHYSGNNGNAGQTPTIALSDPRRIIIEDLEPGTTYYVQVHAHTQTVGSDSSITYKYGPGGKSSGSTEGNQATEPVSFSSTAESSSSVFLQWYPPAVFGGELDGYIITVTGDAFTKTSNSVAATYANEEVEGGDDIVNGFRINSLCSALGTATIYATSADGYADGLVSDSIALMTAKADPTLGSSFDPVLTDQQLYNLTFTISDPLCGNTAGEAYTLNLFMSEVSSTAIMTNMGTVTAGPYTYGSTDNSVIDSGGSVWFKVVASHSSGAYSSASNVVKMRTVSSTPGDPVIGTFGDIAVNSVTANWAAPALDGGFPVEAYKVRIAPYGDDFDSLNASWVDVATVGSTVRSVGITGLTRLTTYTVTIACNNTNGFGDYSDSSASSLVTTLSDKPTVPQNLTISLVSGAAVGVSPSLLMEWLAPADNGGGDTAVTVSCQYRVGTAAYAAIVSNSALFEKTVSTSFSTAYTFRCKASNSAGDSPYTDEVVSTAVIDGVPDPLLNISASAIGHDSFTLEWATDESASLFALYMLDGTYKVVNASIAGTDRSLEFTELDPLTDYSFKMYRHDGTAWSLVTSVFTVQTLGNAVAAFSLSTSSTKTTLLSTSFVLSDGDPVYSFYLHNTGTADLNVTAFEIEPEYFTSMTPTVPFTIPYQGSPVNVLINLDVDTTVDFYQNLNFTTNNLDDEIAEVVLFSSVAVSFGIAELDTTSMTFDFNRDSEGEISASDTFIVNNTGSLPLKLTSMDKTDITTVGVLPLITSSGVTIPTLAEGDSSAEFTVSAITSSVRGYYIGNLSINHDGENSPNLIEIEMWVRGVPPNLAGLAVASGITQTAANISWTALTDLQIMYDDFLEDVSYTVLLSEGTSFSEEVAEFSQVGLADDTVELQYTDLAPYTDYTAKLFSMNVHGNSTGTTVSFKTLPFPPEPVNISSVVFSAITSSSLTLSWDAAVASDTSVTYIIAYTTGSTTLTATTTSLTKSLTSLTVGAEYSFTISARSASLPDDAVESDAFVMSTPSCGSSTSTVCGGQGVCHKDASTLEEACVCSTMFIGDNCDVECPGTGTKCNDNGDCVFKEGSSTEAECDCDTNYYNDECSFTSTCTVVNDSITCSGNGDCVEGTTECNCDNGYAGDQCDYECPGLCSGRGSCSYDETEDTAECDCEDPYIGAECQFTCPTYLGSVCGSHGTCLAYNSSIETDTQDNYYCGCDAGYLGDSCEVPCPVTSSKVCNNKGTCSLEEGTGANATDTGVCTCDFGYLGEGCTVSCLGSSTYSTNTSIASVCNGNGICSLSGSSAICTCENGYSGTECLTSPAVTAENEATDLLPSASISITIIWGVSGLSGETLEFDPDFDLSDPLQQQFIYDKCDEMRNATSLIRVSLFDCFMISFADYVENAGGTFPMTDQDDFYTTLNLFVDDESTTGGSAYKDEICVNDAGRPTCTTIEMITFLDQDLSGSALEPDYDYWVALIDGYNAEAPAGLRTGRQTSSTWPRAVMEMKFISGTFTACGVALGTSTLALAVFTRNVMVTLMAAATLIMVLVSVAGMFVVMGWSLGAIEAVSLSFMIGIAVDYVMHLGHSFVHAPKGASSRVVHSIGQIGSSVLSASATTTASTIVLVWCEIAIFKTLGVIIALTSALSIFFALGTFMSFLAIYEKATCCLCCKKKPKVRAVKAGRDDVSSSGSVSVSSDSSA